jgi:hypothetical protein
VTKTTALIFAMSYATLVLISLHFAGIPALPDERLAADEWRVLAVAPLDNDQFLVSVRYRAGDIRTYRLTITDPRQRDEFLRAIQAQKKGRALNGKAARGRAGQIGDDAMGFSFRNVPDLQPKETSP